MELRLEVREHVARGGTDRACSRERRDVPRMSGLVLAIVALDEARLERRWDRDHGVAHAERSGRGR